ncbi:hypothetical protein [Flammeovirga sp. SJP92]|uniref:hypothetical protein n=1 Tax=Flammeovirga sp. SJP92 TaxID=1775430 RepID=UPI000786A522|nr:hypothetical protein [Flammeovirga sp. SJP92]KXX67471.1 hypothetical protein AVL50_26830 [Flammeovirga sp. SJP92]
MDIKKAIAQLFADIIGYVSVAATATTHISFLGEFRDGNITAHDLYVLFGLVWLFFKVIKEYKELFIKDNSKPVNEEKSMESTSQKEQKH